MSNQAGDCRQPTLPSLSLANQIGTFASVLTVAAFMPQALKILRQGEARAVSLRMYLLLVGASTLWIWFGVVIASVPVIVTNSICLVLQACTLALKLQTLRRDRPGTMPP